MTYYNVNLSFIKEPPVNFDLKEKEWFIYFYGFVNCRILKFKKSDEVIKIMKKNQFRDFSKNEREFILDNSEKEVLCYISYGYTNIPSIFVYGYDNIPFNVECFV